MARIIKTKPGQDGYVRSVTLKIANAKGQDILERPISKIVLILESDGRFPDEEPDEMSR